MHRLPLNSSNFIDIFKPPEVKYSDSINQDDPGSNYSIILDWVSELLVDYQMVSVDPPLRIKNSLKNVEFGNEELFDNLVNITRIKLNQESSNIYQHLLDNSSSNTEDDKPTSIDYLKLLFQWVILMKDKLFFCYSLLKLNNEQIQLMERASDSIFQKLLTDSKVELLIVKFYELGLFQPSNELNHLHLIESSKLFKKIDLNNELTDLIFKLINFKIKRHIVQNCSNVWNRPVLNELWNWVDTDLYPKLERIIPVSNFNESILKNLVKNQLVDLRIKEIFKIVLSYPISKIGLKELHECLLTDLQQTKLISNFIKLSELNLLHSGINTIDIIKCYISTIRSFLIVDHRGVLLDKVCRPIRSYLKERKDTIERVVFALLDTSNENKLIELAIELRKTGSKNKLLKSNNDVSNFKESLNWVPDPIDALTDFRKGIVEDIVESVISIFDSKNTFLLELIKVFSNQLLNVNSNDPKDFKEICIRLKLLKQRFNNSIDFSSLDVMINDLLQSKSINKLLGNTTSSNSTILSHLYWPELSDESFKLPAEIQNELTNFEQLYRSVKKGRKLNLFPSLGLVDLSIEFNNCKSVDFKVSPDKASIIYFFQNQKDGAEIKLAIICINLQMSLKLANEGLQYWCKRKVLIECGLNTYKVNEDI